MSMWFWLLQNSHSGGFTVISVCVRVVELLLTTSFSVLCVYSSNIEASCIRA